MSIGWVSIHRKIFDNPIWLSEKFTKAQAWVDLLLLANHEKGYIFVRGIKIDIERGQVGWSENSLSSRWKWSRTKVKNFLKILEKEQQIKQQINKISLIITIINYNQYQERDSKKSNKVYNRSATEEQEKDPNNNVNNENNENNISVPLKDGSFFIPSDEFLEILKVTYKNINIEQEFKKILSWCVSNPDKQKTERGSKKFINGWMNRANDKVKPVSKTDISTESWF